jgi:hypothetical protein
MYLSIIGGQMIDVITILPMWQIVVVPNGLSPQAKKYIIVPCEEYNPTIPEYIQMPDGRVIQILSWMDEFPEYVECFSILKNPSEIEIMAANKFKLAEDISDFF